MKGTDIQELSGALDVLANELNAFLRDDPLPRSVADACTKILERLGHPPDIVCRQFSVGSHSYWVLFFAGSTDDALISQGILYPLLAHAEDPLNPTTVPIGQVRSVTTLTDAVQKLLAHQALVADQAGGRWWAFDVGHPPTRSVSEPSNAKVVHGPHEGFVEQWVINLALLRQYLQTPYLRVETLTVGFWTQTTVAVIYLEGLAGSDVVTQVHEELSQASLRGLVDSSRIAMALSGPWVIPTVQYSERPDQVAAALIQGRVAIMMDKSPSVLLVPTRFTDLMSRPGDYYQLPLTGSLTRFLRYTGMIVATTLPAIYVAALTVNPSFIPLSLYLTTVRTRLAIPFPVVIETVMMLVVVDIVQEAGLIMPGALGQTVTIFGSLILGDAAIKAGIVSAPTLITVTLAMLSQFLIPDANLMSVTRLIRYALLPLAAVFGFTGIVSGWMLLLGLGVRLESFGTPYFSPLAPLRPGGWRDTVVRMPGQKRKRSPFLDRGAS